MTDLSVKDKVCCFCPKDWVVAWLNGSALVAINVLTPRRTPLIPGWVTVSGWVNHLGM